MNVKCSDAVIKATRACWASLFTSRAIYYRQKNNFPHEDVLIAVVIQKMVNSDKAGVMFTVNPVTNDRDEMIIEGAFGLGESVVSGQITPDSFVVDKKSETIKEKHINTQDWGLFRSKKGENEKRDIENPGEPVITDEEVILLGNMGKMIENHYGKPQDIEWAIEADNLYIVQSRPVTTLK